MGHSFISGGSDTPVADLLQSDLRLVFVLNSFGGPLAAYICPVFAPPCFPNRGPCRQNGE